MLFCHLEDGSRQVAHDEGGCHSGVTSLQQVDDVQEEEMPWDYEDNQDSG